MKYLIFLLCIVLYSCTKQEPIQYGKKPECMTRAHVGSYSVVKTVGMNWLYSDTLYFSVVSDEARILFPQQSRVNGYHKYYIAPNNCNINEFWMQADTVGSLLTHYISFNHDTLVDILLKSNFDTISSKYYKKY